MPVQPGIDAIVPIPGSPKVRFFISVGAAKHVPEIDENRVQLARICLKKNSLPKVGMPSADVYQPGEPEVRGILDTREVGPGENFVYIAAPATQIMRAEADATSWFLSAEARLRPAVWISIKEIVGDHKRSPRSNRKAISTVELSPSGLVESKAGALNIGRELDDVNVAIAPLGQKRL